VEDRLSTGLLLEMIRPTEGGSPDDAARWQREVGIPAALATDSFARATPFENLKHWQTMFPPKIEDFTHLTVYEIDEANVRGAHERAASTLPDGDGRVRVNRMAYRHYPRPGQGVVTGNPLTGIYLILITPTDRKRAQELRDWADFVHIHYIAAARPRGFTMITPFENVRGEDPLFMHFYELETDDPVKATDEMTPQVCEQWGFPLDLENPDFQHWAVTEPLDIWFVDVFRRLDGI
jgi:hypothetical protein